ncbi:AraC family transcriptional regulator [Veronia pacifica]|uniref:AraC family transcriptional regulator n=2 Tax=Veronia pacifica TaxID=1080227 RepID=A0A1C3EPU6_9GAMM|nr:AraC family transcriptional regulator [Veronia pacifica]
MEDQSIGYLENYTTSQSVDWHMHEQYELRLIVNTNGKVMIGNHLGPFSPGHLTLIGPWLPHNWVSQQESASAKPLRDMVIRFKPELFKKAYTVFPELSQFSAMLEQARMGIEFFDIPLVEAEHKFRQIRDSEGVSRLLHFLNLINYLSESRTQILSTIPTSIVKDATTLQCRISNVVDYVMQNYKRQIRLKDVAARLDMTESYFSRFFHRTTGHRFIDFVNRVRVQRACVMLTETTDQVASICKQVGFHNLANFSRQFRRIKGVSPMAYRKKHTGQ